MRRRYQVINTEISIYLVLFIFFKRKPIDRTPMNTYTRNANGSAAVSCKLYSTQRLSTRVVSLAYIAYTYYTIIVLLLYLPFVIYD